MANETDPGSFWMPPQASTVSGEVDAAFDFTFAVSIGLLVVLVLSIAWLVLKFPRTRSDQRATMQPTGSRFVQVAGALILSTAAVLVFVKSAPVFLHQGVAPAGAYVVEATAKDWGWTFTHPNGAKEAKALTVPAQMPVKLLLRTEDRAYNFTVPEFRVQQGVVPGRIATAWFEARRPGEFRLACPEPCGAGKAPVVTTIKVTDRDPTFNGPKQPRPAEVTQADWGAGLYKKLGCNACHSVNGVNGVGPSFKGLYGKMESLKGGGQVKVDDAYLAESIRLPQAKYVAGYTGAMPAFDEKKVDKDDLESLIAFIKAQK